MLALFEYAFLLALKFGKQFKISTGKKGSEAKADGKCLAMDRYALRVFVAVYVLTVGIYFYKYYHY